MIPSPSYHPIKYNSLFQPSANAAALGKPLVSVLLAADADSSQSSINVSNIGRTHHCSLSGLLGFLANRVTIFVMKLVKK